MFQASISSAQQGKHASEEFTGKQLTKIKCGIVLPSVPHDVSAAAGGDGGCVAQRSEGSTTAVYRLGLLTGKCIPSFEMTCSGVVLKNRSSNRKACVCFITLYNREQAGKSLKQTYEETQIML